MENKKTIEMTWNFDMSSAPVFEHLIITYIDDSGDTPFSVVTVGEQNYHGDWYDICNGEFILNYKVCAYMKFPEELPVNELRSIDTTKNTTKTWRDDPMTEKQENLIALIEKCACENLSFIPGFSGTTKGEACDYISAYIDEVYSIPVDYEQWQDEQWNR